MRQKKFFPALILAVGVLCGITIGASAASGLQEITAYLNGGITIKYNNEVQTLLDANGSRIYPITYNGSTYLPIRAVAGLVGLDVDWDQATQTVLLGEQETRTDLLETLKPYTTYTNKATSTLSYSVGAAQFIQSTDGQTQTVGGITVDHWLTLYNRYTTGADYPTGNVTSSFNLEGKYSTLTFSCYTDKDTTLTIYGDNESVLAQYNLVGGQVPQTFTVNLMGTSQLSFVRGPGWTSSDPTRNVYCTIFNAYVE